MRKQSKNVVLRFENKSKKKSEERKKKQKMGKKIKITTISRNKNPKDS